MEFLKSYTDTVVQSVLSSLSREHFDNCIDSACIHSLSEDDMKDYYPTINGKTVHIRAKSQQEMAGKVAQMLGKTAEGQITLSDYADKWLERKKSKPAGKRIRDTTVVEYSRQIIMIKRFFGDTPLGSLSTAHVQQFADWLAHGKSNGLKNDIAEKTITRTLATLRQIVEDAVEVTEVLPRMPYKPKLIENNGRKSTHHKALPSKLFDAVRRAIPTLDKPQERILMALLATTGMRPEEIYGLRWEDISPDWHYIQIKRAVTYPERSKPVVGKPKTNNSNRFVNLVGWVADSLKPYAQESGYIFGGDNPLCYSSVKRLQRGAWANVGLKGTGVTPYDFRANFATMLCESGKTDKQVADLMGHADTRMVNTVYAPARKDGILMHNYACEQLFGM